MARSDTVAKVRSLLYGSGLYEKPAIRTLGGAGNTLALTNSKVTLTTAEATSISKGDVLSVVTGAAATAYAFYVTGTTTTTVTALGQWLGSPNPDSADLSNAILEQNPKATEHEIHEAIDTILNSYLWPEVFDITSSSVTPDLSTMQVEVPATVRKVMGVWQLQGGKVYPLAGFSLHRNLPTALSSTGVLLEANFRDGSTAYYQNMAKITETSDEPWVEDLLAYGAAALLIDSSVPNVVVPYRPDNTDGQVALSVGEAFWRSFLQLREQARLDLSREYEEFVTIH